jgi:hypothetical protein
MTEILISAAVLAYLLGRIELELQAERRARREQRRLVTVGDWSCDLTDARAERVVAAGEPIHG